MLDSLIANKHSLDLFVGRWRNPRHPALDDDPLLRPGPWLAALYPYRVRPTAHGFFVQGTIGLRQGAQGSLRPAKPCDDRVGPSRLAGHPGDVLGDRIDFRGQLLVVEAAPASGHEKEQRSHPHPAPS